MGLTFEIKLLDGVQRVVDKVETSESLQEKKNFMTFSFTFFKELIR